MDIQLLIRNANGEVVSKHALNPQDFLSLKAPQQNASFEIHNSDGEAPKKIAMKKTGNHLTLRVEDEATGEISEILLEDYVVTEATVIVASGADGVIYPYTFDALTETLTLSSVSLASASEISVAGLLAGIGGALVGVTGLASGLSDHSSEKGEDSSSDSGSNSGGSTGSNEVSPPDNDASGENNSGEDGSGEDDTTPDNGGENGSDEGGIAPDNGGENGSDEDGTAPDNGSDEGDTMPDNGGNNTGTVITDDEGNTLKDGDTVAGNTPTLGGDGQAPGSTVEIKDGDTVIGETVADEDGSWSFTPDAPLADGEHDLVVVITDPEGNESSDTITVIVDTSDEDTTADNGGENGSGEDGTAPDNNGENGSDEDGSTPDNGGENGSGEEGTTPDNGGENDSDEDGIVPDNGGENDPEEDGTAPDNGGENDPEEDETAPGNGGEDDSDEEIPTPDNGENNNTGTVMTDDDGNTLKDGDTVAGNTPTLGGDGQAPGSTVEIKDGDTVIGETVADEDGSWSFTPDEPLADGEHDLVVVITDPEGNESSETINIVVDTEAPERLSPEEVTLTDDNGLILDHDSLVTDGTPTFTGKGTEPGTKVIIRDNGEVIGEGVVNDTGDWTFTPEEELGEGDHRFTFEVVDAAGNTAGESAAVTVTIDTLAPEGVDISAVTLLDEAGEEVSAASTLTDSKVTFKGSNLEAGTTVTLYDKGAVIGRTQVDEEGSWSLTVSEGLYDGTHDVTFSVTDTAGNRCGPSDSLSLTVEAINLIAKDNISSDASLGFTYDTSVEELGTLIQAGGLVELFTWVTSDPLEVADGTVMDLVVDATSSSFFNIASTCTLILQKFNAATQVWEKFQVDESNNLFGMFGLGAVSTQLIIQGLTAGQYRLNYGTQGINVGTGISLDAKTITYRVADEATMTDYTTASGNVFSDADNANGSDSLPHPAHTSVTSGSVTNSEGVVTTVALETNSSTSLVGKYGTLTLYSDGSYQYIPDVAMSSIGKVDSFTYTLTDAATGKSSSANIHVQIGSNNDHLSLSWDPTDPTASAVTDIASDNSAAASMTVKTPVTSITTKETDVLPKNEIYTETFTLTSAEDVLSGSLTLTTHWQLSGENYEGMMFIQYSVQRLNSEGEWELGNVRTVTIMPGIHNAERVLDLNLSELMLNEGTYRIAIKTLGTDNWLKINMNAEIIHNNNYDLISSSEAQGNFLTDEGSDGSTDRISSIYTRIYAKSGDSTGDTAIDGSYTLVTESGVTITGQYGTLILYNNGTYVYKPDLQTLPGGAQDIFTYALKSANGSVVTATITVNLGVTVDGSHGGELIFAGTEANDMFRIVDTDFRSVNGGDGNDTLVWAGKGTLNLNDIEAKVTNIESVVLEVNQTADSLVISAENVYQITNEQNALYVRGGTNDALTLAGRWTGIGKVVVDGVSYQHYKSVTASGHEVNIFVEITLNLATETLTEGGRDEDITLIEITNDLTLSAQNLVEIAEGNSTLYVKGTALDTVTLEGSWQLVGGEIYNNTYYKHYTSVTSSGETVDLYLDRSITLSKVETAAGDNPADITGDVEVASDSVEQSGTLKGESSEFISNTFTINDDSDTQIINLKVSSGGINDNNTVYIGWSLEKYDAETGSWLTVLDGARTLHKQDQLELDFSGQNAGLYRIVTVSSQSGYENWWQINYNEIKVTVEVSIISSVNYVVMGSERIEGSVLASDDGDGTSLVRSIAVGIVSGAASYTVVAAAGTTLSGLYGTLTIYQDGGYSYALNSDTLLKQTGSEDLFTYVLTDGTVKNLTMTIGVSVEGARGGELSLTGTVGNDSFALYDTNFTKVDGQGGKDTLIWKGQGEVQLSDIKGKISNIEVIDLQQKGSTTLVLSAEEIAAVTDADNKLFIRGDKQDSLSLSGTWQVSGSEVINNITYTLYNGTTLNGTAVKLYVQDGVQFNEVEELLTGSLAESEALSVISIAQNGVVAEISGDSVSLKGAYGTLVMNKEGNYTYQLDEEFAHSGKSDNFIYTLSDGSQQTVNIELGITDPGLAASLQPTSGSGGSDLFNVFDTDFISINGGEDSDTLAWHGEGTLNLNMIASRVHNIEKIDLMNDGKNDNVVISAESLLKVTDDNNTLYIRGAEGDTVTLNGRWEAEGDIISNGVNYHHYSSVTANGTVVQLYIEDDVSLG